MGNPHITHLEDSKWTDKVFTGDSDKNTAALNFFARQRELATQNDRYKGRQTTVDPTVTERLFRNEYKKGLLARQSDKSTLEDKVSFIKVKDARKAFRRRYASRTNIEQLFNQYDADSKGYINAYDLLAQGQKIGLGLSLNESLALVQSAKDQKSGDMQLNKEEFEKLIFSQDEKLDIDLKQLKPLDSVVQVPSSSQFEQPSGSVRIQNQWKYYLQKSLKNITNDMLTGDPDRNY